MAQRNGAKFWIGVVSQAHVRIGQAGGFCQLNHGKAAPMRRLRAGDWLVYYSPRTEIKAGDPVQAFTAIGQILDREPYEVTMAGGFTPTRRDIEYLTARDAPIRPLLPELEFTPAHASWGLAMRRGTFQISRADFDLIAEAMTAEVAR